MSGWIRPGIQRLFRLATGRRADPTREVDEEIQYHLEQRTERLIREGLSPQEARAEAERRFGDQGSPRTLYLAATRRARRIRLADRLEGWWFDLRFAVRGLARDRAFTAFVVVTMAVGIGTNVAIFGVADRLLLTGPAAVTEPERLIRFHLDATYPDGSRGFSPIRNYPAYTMFRAGTRSFTGAAAYSPSQVVVGEGMGGRLRRVGWATADFFDVLGSRPARGRFYTAEEDDLFGPSQVAVVGHHYWAREMGSDPGVVGQQLIVEGTPYTVIGVAPAGFTGAELTPMDLWLPISNRGLQQSASWHLSWDNFWLVVIGRLQAGVTLEEASAEATSIFQRTYNGRQSWMGNSLVQVVPNSYSYGGRERAEARVARWLMGTAAIVLVIACANVINLTLARTVRRRREVAVRLALGAGRGRLARLLIMESGVLATLAGVASVAVAVLLGGMVWRVVLPEMAATVSLAGSRNLAVVVAITLLCAIAVGVLPALRAAQVDLTPALKSGTRQGGASRSRTRAILTVAQAALSVILLAGAGLFVRSLWTISRIDLGLEPDRVLVADLRRPAVPRTSNLETRQAERRRQRALELPLLEQARAVPGVESAALAVGLPYHSSFGVRLRVPGVDSIPELPGGGPYISAVTADYFRTVGTPLLAGRVFTDADREGSEPVAIVNDLMGALLWPGQTPLGQCLFLFDEGTACFRVVGIVASVHKDGFREEPSMQYYVPKGQEQGFSGSELLIRPRGGVGASTDELRRQLQALDPSITHVEFTPLQESLDPQLRPWRLGVALFGLCGALALLVTAVGLYSVLSYLVAERTHEIGVRIALGSTAAGVMQLVVRGGAILAGGGALLGLAIAFLAGGWIEPLLFDTSGRDPVVFTAVTLVILGVSLVASLVPARRAAQVSPMTALRSE